MRTSLRLTTINILSSIIFLLGSLACTDESILHCDMAFDQPPACLLEDNDYVMLAQLTATDTLAFLGSFVDLVDTLDERLVAYTYRPLRILKSPSQVQQLSLWYVTGFNRTTHCPVGPSDSIGSKHLVYGNDLCAAGHIAYVFTPWMKGGVETVSATLNGAQPDFFLDFEPALFDSLMAQQRLVEARCQSNASRPIVFGSDRGLSTHRSFDYDKLIYCDSATMTPYSVSADEYLEALEKLSQGK